MSSKKKLASSKKKVKSRRVTTRRRKLSGVEWDKETALQGLIHLVSDLVLNHNRLDLLVDPNPVIRDIAAMYWRWNQSVLKKQSEENNSEQ